MVNLIEIAGRRIGPGFPTFVIAEAGVNHNGNIKLAEKLVDIAREAGADAVKFQTFRAARLVTESAPKANYQIKNTQAIDSQFNMLKGLELDHGDHRRLMARCRRRGILFLSTPFDEESADLLVELGVAALKIPSGEITNLPFLEHVARKGLPLIVSTGMCSLGEVEAALEIIHGAGNPSAVLLHCVSSYPAEPADCNLKAIHTLTEAFGVPVGWSDHVLGNEIALAAVACGARVVEKHFTLDRHLPGPDHKASATPDELAALVRGIRQVEMALGDGRKRAAASEANTAEVARKSLAAAVNIPRGSRLTAKMITVLRPGTGLPPSFKKFLIGRRVRLPLKRGELLRLDVLA